MLINNVIVIVIAIAVLTVIGALSTFAFICDFFAEMSERRDKAKFLEQTLKKQSRDIAILESNVRTLNAMIESMRMHLNESRSGVKAKGSTKKQ